MQTLKVTVNYSDSLGRVIVTTEENHVMTLHGVSNALEYLKGDQIIIETRENLGFPPKDGFRRGADYLIKERVHVLR